MTPLFRMFLGVLLTILFTEECCGQTENYRYWNCSYTITCHCDSGAFFPPVCKEIGSTEVAMYYNQTENPRKELNITCTLKESVKNASCSDMELPKFKKLTYDCGSFLCHILIPLELSEHCTVKNTNYTAMLCDSQCLAQMTTTPVLPSTTLSTQSNSGLAGATCAFEPTPSFSTTITSSSNAPGCMLGRVSCYIVYIVVGLGALTTMVVLLLVVIIVLVCISVKRGKKEMQGTEKAREVELHTYDVVAQPMGGETVPNDQQHIHHRTQHTNIVDTIQQTHDEYHKENTTGQEYEHLHNARQTSRREEARSRKHDYEQVSTGEQNESETLPSHENLYHVVEDPIEVSSSRALTTTAADMYSTPNFSLKGQPQTPVTQDNFYHVLEGPTLPTGTSMYSSADRSTTPGKEDDNDYDEPVLLTGNKAGHQLFDDPKYQSTFAPVMPTQPDTLPQKLPDRAKIKLLPNLACASPVKEAATSDSSFQTSAVTSPANPTEGKWNDMHAFWKDAQEDDYDQPAVITIRNKDLIDEGGDQPVLFDDPTYQVASAPV